MTDCICDPDKRLWECTAPHDLPEAFKPKDRDAYLTQPPGPAQAIEFGHYQGYNAALEAVTPLYIGMRERAEKAEQRFDALAEANGEQFKVIGKAERERYALVAHLHDILTGPTLGFSPATADRMIADTLKEARGDA